MTVYVPSVPFNLQSGSVFDATNDGRLVVCNGDVVSVETGAGARIFNDLAKLPSATPNFVRVSPGSAMMTAIGDYNAKKVYIVDAAGVVTQMAAENYDAEWLSDRRIAISAGPDGPGMGPVVRVLDTVTGDNTVIVRLPPGSGSGGVTIDPRSGNLYVGDGADPNPPATGTIKAYTNPEWSAALGTKVPIDFSTRGIVVADLLSAAALDFDRQGNLIVGGAGPTVSERGYVAVVDAGALASALAGGPPVTSASPPNELQRLDPDPADNVWWFTVTNPATGELYMKDYAQAVVHVFVPVSAKKWEGRRSRSDPGLTVVECDPNFHLGDNPAAYPGTIFCNFELQRPLDIPPVGASQKLFVRMETSYMETFSISKHAVLLDGTLLGAMSDDSNGDDHESFEFLVSEALARPARSATLTIKCQKLDHNLSDDFLVRGYGTRVAPP